VGDSTLRPRSKVWLERDGRVVLSEWRAQLLELIERTGSLSAAAAELKVPYRTAWNRLREIEAGLGFKVLETQAGGAEGGHSSLTPEGKAALMRFQRVAAGVSEQVNARFRESFPEETT
jgi:molybdate transport system regulatory protein